jgi:serine/threonine-protein kinase
MLIGKERMQQEIWFQKYHIIRMLGSGGTARVYLAKHIKLNSYRAIKCISKTHPLYDLQRNEALILKNLKHSCIPIIYDIEEDEEGSYIIEQYLEGETLKDYVQYKGPIKEDIIISYAIQLCDLFHYLHSNDRPILYVDLKPDNIMVSGKSIKLIDFGSAIYQDELNKEPRITATRGYAAPELYRQGVPDDRCDIYGIGMLLYYMATGVIISATAKQISNIDQISGCSKGLKHIINHCLKFNPVLRYTTVAQLKKHLSALQPGREGYQELGQKRIIAVAGTQSRIGVTHLAFRLCYYMKSQGVDCIYKEDNQSQCIRRMKGHLELSQESNSPFILEGIPMLSAGQFNEPATPEASITVIDLGTLTKDNLDFFLEADTRLLVMGAKDWELAYSEEVLDMIAEHKDIIYLFNFLDGKQFQMVCRNMEQRCCYRIPYEPNPFGKITAQNGQELFRMLLEVGGCYWLTKGRIARVRKGRNRNYEA